MSLVLAEAIGAASVVTLNRPERLNAIGFGLLAALHAALAAAQADPATRVIVLAGAGRAFCAGDDLKEFEAQGANQASATEMAERTQQITRDLMMGPKLVIGAVQGYAVGAGFEWMLNCDLVVAADDLQAFLPEMSLGHFVTGGITHLLPQAVGYQRAMEMMVLGERFGAADLQRLGLVNRVVPRAQLLAAALQLAEQLAERPPHATARLKRVLNAQADGALAMALVLEQQAAVECFGSEETARRVAARRARP